MGEITWKWGGGAEGMGDELMGKGGMPLVCAQGWKESLVLSSSPEPVPKSHAPTVLYKTRREEEKAARGSAETPVRPRQETVPLIWTPHFPIPLSFLFENKIQYQGHCFFWI